MAGPPSPIRAPDPPMPSPANRADDPGGLLDDAHAIVDGVGDVEVAVARHRHGVRPVQRRLRRLLQVAVEPGDAGTRDRHDLPVGAIDPADAIVLRVGHIQIAVGADGDVGGRRKLQRCKLADRRRRRGLPLGCFEWAGVEAADQPVPRIGEEQIAVGRHCDGPATSNVGDQRAPRHTAPGAVPRAS